MNPIQIELAKKKALLGQPIDIEVAAKIIAQDRERIEELEQELEELQGQLTEAIDQTDSIKHASDWVDELEYHLDMQEDFGNLTEFKAKTKKLLRAIRAQLT